MNEAEVKLTVFGQLATDPDLDLLLLVQKYKTPIAKLRRWKKEFDKANIEATLVTTLTADEKLIDRIAREVLEEDLPTPEPLEVDPETNEIITLSEYKRRQDLKQQRLNEIEVKAEYKKQQLETFKDSVNGLQTLQLATQATAGQLVHVISEHVENLSREGHPLISKELQMLASALTSIQNAFFNRPVNNITVNNQTNVEGASLSEFRASLKA